MPLSEMQPAVVCEMIRSKTLVVEDDHDIAELLAVTMKKAGCRVALEENGYEALDTPGSQRGLLILDLMIPGIDGLNLCEEIERIIGLELGADDNLVKPFSPRELLLRVRLVLGRSANEYKPEGVFRKSGLEIDFERHRVSLHGREVVLTATQFKLLSVLVKSRGRVLDREQLLDMACGCHFEGYDRTIDTHLSRIRQKLGSCGDLIETVRGFGYRFSG
jgi:two-component system phosphate regulon response regulator PhoB